MRDIAIVGMGCRFPGADNLTEYWRMLRAAERQFRAVPDEKTRWRHADFYDPDDRRASRGAYTDQLALIEGVDQFDAMHFRMSPRRVQAMDPQHRLLLQASREALQDAGWERREFDRPGTGVFFAMSSSEYMELVTDVRTMQPFSVPGGLLNMAAATVSQYYDLGGPSFTVDAACSSGLVALYEAVTHLRAGQCTTALVGGSYLALAPAGLVGFSKVGALSAAGVCRPFDRRADGFVLGEGVGVLVLRPLDVALAAGDRVYAVVKGVGCSNDGITDGPMTPRKEGQVLALSRAFADAGVAPRSVGLIEAHGTATVVGDRVELESLKEVRGDGEGQAYLSSVKSLIGHGLSASGLASLIKVSLALHHGIVPPHPDTETDPEVGLADAGLTIPGAECPFPASDKPRRGSVSGFGFGGTNLHVILEQAPDRETPATESRPELFVFSAGSVDLLMAHLDAVLGSLTAQPDTPLRDLAHALSSRELLAARLAVVAADRAELVGKLTEAGTRLAAGALGTLGDIGHAGKAPLAEDARRIAFVFPGQGSQSPGMSGDLFERFATFRERARDLDQTDLLGAVYGPDADTDAGRERLTGTDVCQPVLGIMGLAARGVLGDLGLAADVTLGHSAGEFPAAAVAGALTDAEAVALLATRGQRMRAAEAGVSGGMLALRADGDTTDDLLSGVEGAWPGCYNHPLQTVVSGTEAGLVEVERRCVERGITAQRLDVSNAFHSPLLDSARDGIAHDLADQPIQPPTTTFVSSVDGTVTTDPDRLRALWIEHAVAPIRFSAAARAAYDSGARVFVQLSGGRALLSTIRQNLREHSDAVYVPLTGDRPDDARTFLAAVGQLAVIGVPVDLAALFPAGTGLATLPPSPLRTRAYWLPVPADRSGAKNPVDRSSAEPTATATTALREENPVSDVVALLREQLAVLRALDPTAAGLADALNGAVGSPSALATVTGRAAVGQVAVGAAAPGHPSTGGDTPAGGIGRDEIRSVVLGHISRISAFPVDHLADSNLIVQELGFDSLMTTELVGSVARTWPQLADKLAPGTIATRPTVAEIVATLAGLLGAPQSPTTGDPAGPGGVEGTPAAAPPDAAAAAGVAQPHSAIPREYRIEDFPEARALAEQIEDGQGRNPYFLVHEGTAAGTTRIDGRDLLSFSSYNYLGLSGHPGVHAAVTDAIGRYGTSVSASRFLSGERPLHHELESELAGLLGVEDAIAMVSGHATNVTVIGHLVGPEDLIVHDALAHDSILQGCALSGARRLPFPHNDVAALDALLSRARDSFRRVLIVVEGVYSMDGDLVDLPALIEVARRHEALLMVDEAHSLGTVGPNGGGVGDHFGVDRSGVDLWSGTLSKSLASCGGYVAGNAQVIRYLKYSVPGFVYSVGLTPSNTAAALAAIRAMAAEPERLERLRNNSKLFLTLARQAGINTGDSADSPVVPCIVGDSVKAMALADRLYERGISANPIMYPAVPEEHARLRFFITSEHTAEQIEWGVGVLADELKNVLGSTS
ncbi:type I polyketide synthase [Longispora fulva]|uniref:8-amino-7-oxononanoate synthase n=1 Tax=Longispora fulva TaxID=619741 RepID=A0A8J7GSV0_9ACTN|nr:type I polyketide synthase [Longispora fulva]MBG6136441.1 8-amino-7-oxononanoate synthase [Longispora fulva]